MRLLCFSDLHADLAAARSLAARSSSFDVLIGAGDFGNVRRDLQPCIDVLAATAKPAILVAGNNESHDELAAACRGWREAHVLHGTGAIIDGVEFFGLGGGVPVTPFGAWSFDLTEEDAAQLLWPCPERAVLVTHSPPKGVLDLSSGGRSLGSTAVLAAIRRTRPQLVVCGHIHASGGKRADLEGTPVVNAGPAGIDWILPESRTQNS